VRFDQDDAALRKVVRCRFAELGDAGRRTVVRLPGAHRFARRLADVGRRVEVRLTDLEVDDRATAPLERLRLDEHTEGSLRSETLEARCKTRCDGGAHLAPLR